MIRIFRSPPGGPAPTPSTAEPVLRLDAAPTVWRSWNGIRSLLRQVSDRVGEDRLERAVARHRAAASVVLDHLEPQLSPEERLRREELSAQLDSHLTHNWAIQRPLFDAWAALLVDLLDGVDVPLRVDDVARLDWETMAILKTLYRSFPERSPDLELGYVPEPSPPPLDDQGILWRMRPEYVASAIMGFELLSDTEVVDVEEGRPVQPPSTTPPTGSSLPREVPAGSCLEAEALRKGTDVDLWVTAIERCFARFSFTAAMHLGLELLRRVREQNLVLDPTHAATVHGMIALSGHNRQFHTEGNQALARFLEHHLRAALETEERPLLRCSLLYRLTVTLGRRQGRLDEALDVADQAVAEAREPLLSTEQAVYQGGWARNIRAYVTMRMRRMEDGERDLHRAFETFEPLPSPAAGEAGRRRDRDLTRTLLASNLAALAYLRGDRAAAHHWRYVGHATEKDAAGIEHYEASHWVILCRDFHLPRLGLAQALQGVRNARAENDALWLHRLLLLTADLNDRIGRAHSAARLYRHANALRRRLGHPWLMDRAEVVAAEACARANRFQEARSLLVEALATRSGPRIETRVHAAMARLAARAGVESTVHASLEKAAAAAEASGEDRLRRWVLLAAGRAFERLGQSETARQRYHQALALAEDAEPAERLALQLGLAATEGGEEPIVACLNVLHDALSNADAWWHLPRLLGALEGASSSGELTPWDGHFEALEVLFLAGHQRDDCAEPLERLRQAVPAAADLSAGARARLAAPIEVGTG